MNKLFKQIIEISDLGLIVLDTDFTIIFWSKWLEMNSEIKSEAVVGKNIFQEFPNLDNSTIKRAFKTVFMFGNFVFLSQKIHHYVIPLKPINAFMDSVEYMQQNCTISPLRGDDNKINSILLRIEDVTETYLYEQKLQEANIRDGLTNLYNRRYLMQRTENEFFKFTRYKRTFSIIMIDIDHFKEVNDTYGHQVGDFVLTSFSNLVLSKIRKVDLLARYGGEEFCLIMPETNLKNTHVFGERIRKAVEEMQIQKGDSNFSITISLGITEVSPDFKNFEDMLSGADKALYKSKESGRNQSRIFIASADGGSIE